MTLTTQQEAFLKEFSKEVLSTSDISPEEWQETASLVFNEEVKVFMHPGICYRAPGGRVVLTNGLSISATLYEGNAELFIDDGNTISRQYL